MNRPCQIERRILADLPCPLRAPHDRGEIILHAQSNVHGAALFDTQSDLKQIMGIKLSDGALADQGKTWVRNRLMTVLACPSVQRRDISACHSRATVSKSREAR